MCEKDLPSRLREYKVLYLPATHLLADCLPALVAWVEAGGTLVVCGGGPDRDEANEPWAGLRPLQGLTSAANAAPRSVYYRAEDPMISATEVLSAGSTQSVAQVAGYRTVLVPEAAACATATYTDGSPAIVEHRPGKGRVLTFGFNPGMSLLTRLAPGKDWKAAPQPELKLISAPVIEAGVQAPVSTQVGVDAARLDGPTGSAVTLANYTAQPIEQLTVTIRGVEKVGKVVSAVRGPLPFTHRLGVVTVDLQLDTVDVLKLYSR